MKLEVKNLSKNFKSTIAVNDISFEIDKNKINFFSLSKNRDLNKAASNLYKVFRLIKNKGFKKIQISKIPNFGSGIVINDRIKRASRF